MTEQHRAHAPDFLATNLKKRKEKKKEERKNANSMKNQTRVQAIDHGTK